MKLLCPLRVSGVVDFFYLEFGFTATVVKPNEAGNGIKGFDP